MSRLLFFLCLLAAAAAVAPAAALRQDQDQATHNAGRRKLLQPFNLGRPAATRRSGNVGNAAERRTNAVAFATAGLVDTGRLVNDTIRARTISVGETTNLNFGGSGKVTYQARGATDNTTSQTYTGVDARSIGAPGVGVTAARVIDRSDSLASKRLKPAGALRDASTLGRYEGRNDDVPAGSWEILGTGTLDYGFAGDYDYSIITALVDDRSFSAVGTTYDDDYGRIRAVPSTAAVSSRTRTNLNNPDDRASGFGRLSTTATGYNSVARGFTTSAGTHGVNAARFNDDVAGTGTVFVPPNQFRQVGASAAGASLTKNYKGNPLPGAATNLQNAGTTVSRRYVTGGASDQINYAHGTAGVSLRSQNVALSGAENVDFDAGRRRLQAAKHRDGQQRRRMHAVATA